jgi:hypothetical protein
LYKLSRTYHSQRKKNYTIKNMPSNKECYIAWCFSVPTIIGLASLIALALTISGPASCQGHLFHRGGRYICGQQCQKRGGDHKVGSRGDLNEVGSRGDLNEVGSRGDWNCEVNDDITQQMIADITGWSTVATLSGLTLIANAIALCIIRFRQQHRKLYDYNRVPLNLEIVL